MIVAWATYCLLVATLLGVAAWAFERASRAQGWSGRWPWAVALAGSLALPLAAWLRPSSSAGAASPSAVPMPGAYLMESLPPLMLQPVGAASPSVETVLLWAWAAVSVALLLYLAWSGLRVRAAGRQWRRGEVDGVEVLVSESTGPAALGLLRGRVVLPEWALSLDDRLRRLLVLHESEHVRARDPQLAVAGLVACALMPWNPALWWQLARLRLAIEVDCDARVLRRSSDAAGYGTLLLEVGQRRARLALGLAESRSMLERRIRMITRRELGRRTVRAVGLGAVAAVVLAVACETPPPTGVADAPSPPPGAEEPPPPPVAPDVDLAERPMFTPMTARPQLMNSVAVRQALQDHYPPLLRDAGIAGTVNVWMFIDAEGVIQQVRLHVSSGHDALDAAALRVARVMEFSPASNRGVSVPVWVSLPITFESGDPAVDSAAAAAERVRRERDRAELERRAREAPEHIRGTPLEDGAPIREGVRVDPGAGPVFTPMTERPQLRNSPEVQDALRRNYPPLLRDAGIGGTVSVWTFIDERGVVRRAQINEGSGHEALDRAALRVVEAMEFTPARNRDRPVPVWVALPVTFEIQ